MSKKTITYLSIIIIVIGSIFLANGLILAWTAPTQSPPAGNVSPPLTGTLGTSGEWCTTDGSQVNCTSNNPNTDYCAGGSCGGNLSVSGTIRSTKWSITAPRWDTSFYVAQSQHYYGHDGTQTIYLGEPGNTVSLRGNLNVGGDISFGSTISTGGRMHIDGGERLYLLHEDGVIIGKEWGGSGNLSVQGNLTTGSFANLTSGIAVNNGSNTGDKRGVWLWHPNDPNHVIYSANPSGTSPSGGSPVAGYWDSGHRLRFRTYASGQGFLWENSSEQRMMDLDADSGSLRVEGSLNVGGDISFGSTISTPGTMHIDGGERLYLLHEDGVIIGKEWGGNGQLVVQGNIIGRQHLYIDGNKFFDIKHPDPVKEQEGWRLRHASIESPEIRLYYEGKGEIINGEAIITLPDYFKYLIVRETEIIHLTKYSKGDVWVEKEDYGNNKVLISGEEGTKFTYLISGIREGFLDNEVEYIPEEE